MHDWPITPEMVLAAAARNCWMWHSRPRLGYPHPTLSHQGRGVAKPALGCARRADRQVRHSPSTARRNWRMCCGG